MRFSMKHRNYKNNRQTTKHSATRGKERLGLSKTETKKMANRAFTDGIDFNWTRGELYDLLSSHVGVIRFYANGVYIFRANGRLITVLNIDPKYEQNLLDYVSYPVYVWYKQNRYKYKSNCNDKVTKDVEKAKAIITERILKFFEEKDIKVNVAGISTVKRDGLVNVYVDDLDKITPELKKAFKEQFSMTLTFFEKSTDIENIELFKQEITKWFTSKFAMTIRILYLDPPNFIFRVSGSSYNKNVTKDIISECAVKFGVIPVFRERKNEIIIKSSYSFQDLMEMYKMSDWFMGACHTSGVKITRYNATSVQALSNNLEGKDVKEIAKAFEEKFGKKLTFASKEERTVDVITDFLAKYNVNIANILEINKKNIIVQLDFPEALTNSIKTKFYKAFSRTIYCVNAEQYELIYSIKEWFTDNFLEVNLLEVDNEYVLIETAGKVPGKLKTDFFNAFNRKLDVNLVDTLQKE